MLDDLGNTFKKILVEELALSENAEIVKKIVREYIQSRTFEEHLREEVAKEIKYALDSAEIYDDIGEMFKHKILQG